MRIEAWDRGACCATSAAIVADEKVNMVGVRTQENGDRTVSVFLTLETTGIAQLCRLMTKLEAVRGIMSVTRALDRGETPRKRFRANSFLSIPSVAGRPRLHEVHEHLVIVLQGDFCCRHDSIALARLHQ